MLLECKYDLGQEVFLKTDSDQKKRIIIQVIFNPKGVQYSLACGAAASWHYEMELCTERDTINATTN